MYYHSRNIDMPILNNSPLSMGIKTFFEKYIALSPERFDKYFPGQWKLTERLEKLGAQIRKREVSDEVSLLLFLIDVAVWKEPYENQSKDMIRHVITNSYHEIVSAFNQVWQALDKQEDAKAIDAIGSLVGFGQSDGSRKIASAVLRFLDPSRYAVVDYRNWAILSNTEGRYFEEALLRPLGSTIEGSRKIPIDTKMYLDYLKVVRELASKTSFAPAQIDMALFAYSDELKPLSSTKTSPQMPANSPTSTSVKYQRMEALIVEVINDNKKKGHRRAAQTLEIYLNKVRKGEPTPAALLQMCRSLATRRPDMDLYLASKGTKTIRHILPELERIYGDT